MNAFTVRTAQPQLAEIVQSVAFDHDPTLLITEDDASAVLISLEMFNELQETAHLLSSQANVTHLRTSIAEYKAGNVRNISLEELKAME